MSDNFFEEGRQDGQEFNNLLSGVDKAVKSPTTKLQADWHFLLEGRKKDYKDEAFEDATVEIPYGQVDILDDNHLQLLKIRFSEKVKTSAFESNVKIDPKVLLILNPSTSNNIIDHERDHLKPLPQRVKDVASIKITFIKEPGPDNTITGIQGVATYNTELSNEEKAISCSNPRSLNDTDIQNALLAAEKTGNLDFISFIQERVNSRQKH